MSRTDAHDDGRSPEQAEFLFGGNGGRRAPETRAEPEEVSLGRTGVLEGKAEGPIKQMIDANFLQYASYVIRDRAIPDLDDGLKPVQRRILYSLFENDDGKFIKVANIAGYCMQYHPHGNVSIEDALVTLANKQYLIEGQGNFGNLHTGDPAAASRYIECRLTELARTQLFNDELTKFVPSYDGRRKEPVTLPAKLPLLLMLGAEGIAVGLSTRVLPHNVKELLEAQIAVLQKKPFTLLPDFPQGGVMDAADYAKGAGRVRLRAVIENRPSTHSLVVREIPFGTTTDSLIASIEDAARRKKIKIRSIDDYTGENVEIDIKLPGDQDLEQALQKLYAFTLCEVSISSRIVVIQNQRPVEMNVEEILRHNTKQLLRILERELNLELNRLENELHFKTLTQIFIENRLYKRIEECQTYPDVQQAVLDGLAPFREQLTRDVTRQDVEGLLAIAIKRISLFDMNKNRKDIGDLVAAIDEVERSLSDVTKYTIQYLRNLIQKYAKGYPRKTRIEGFERQDLKELTAQELTIRHDREKGYLGFEVAGVDLFACSSYDKLLLVWRDGRYKVIPPPETLFVDQDLIHCSVFQRDRVFAAVYVHHAISYLKRFTFGGAIMNKEYLCTPPNAEILLFDDSDAETLFVKYKKAKNQRINQQSFPLRKQAVKGVKARGAQMTVKQIEEMHTEKPRHWGKGKTGPAGVTLDLAGQDD